MEEYREQLTEEQRAKLNELYPTYPWSSIRDLFKFLPSEILMSQWDNDDFYYVPCNLKISKGDLVWNVDYISINNPRIIPLRAVKPELIDALFDMVVALKYEGEMKPTIFICGK